MESTGGLDVVANREQGWQRFFGLRTRGTTVSREMLAGATTFAAMSYIMVVNPLILSSTGMSRSGLLLATVLATVVGTLVMALWANLPIALAPGMGSNIVFAQILVIQMGVTWQAGLAMVFLNALLFMILSLTRWRQVIIQSFPEPIKLGMQCSIGIFIAYLGLKSGGVITADSAANIGFAQLTNPAVLAVTIGIVATPCLIALRVPGAFLISIIGITIAGMFIRDGHGHTLTTLPSHFFAMPTLSSDLMFKLDFSQFFHQFIVLLPLTFYFLLSEFFAGTSTMLAVCRRAGLVQSNGEIMSARAAFTSDALASVVGAVAGTTTVTAYAESVTGVEAGGRTGLVGVVVAVLFLVALVASPLITAIPVQATAPTLVLVGILMMEGLREIDVERPDSALPPLLMVVVTACTGDMMIGLALGSFVYTAILIARRDWARLTPVLFGVNAVLVLYLVVRGVVSH
jgi:adenine/guanine/hypoxanthine permease